MKNKNLIGLILAVVVLALSGLLGKLLGLFNDFKDFKNLIKFDPQTILKCLIVVMFLYAINCLIQLVFSLFKKSKGRGVTLVTVLSSLVKYFLAILGFCWILALMGVNVSTIFASVGILALILGFGAESLVADIVTGIFILFENQFNVGDIIEVSGFRGTVVSIGIRTISLKDAGGNIKIINNSDLSNIINRSNNGSVAISEVGISYEMNLDEVESKIDEILQEIKNKHLDIFIGEVAYLGVESLADSAVVLKFKADVEEKNIFTGRRLLNKELKCAFDKHGIVISYPQVDVHMK